MAMGFFMMRLRARVWGNIGAFIIRIGFWGAVYYKYHKEPPKIAQVTTRAPIVVVMFRTGESPPTL